MGIRARLAAAALLGIFAGSGLNTTPAHAADHGDAPFIAGDQACDIADVYLFLDPNDNTQVFVGATFRGFIASGENVNFGIFDPNVRFRFLIENTGDAAPDDFIDVTFTRRVTTAAAQNAKVKFLGNQEFTAPATNSSIAPAANDPVVTTNNGVRFFAGMVDDPFFFDIPAFVRFSASVRAGSPDPSVLNRGRDSFAGYNCMAIAFRMPLSRLKGTGDVVGVSFVTQRRTQTRNANGQYTKTGKWRTIDRMGNPAVNVALIPFARKDLHNTGTPQQDAAGRFLPFILETAEVFGLDDTSIGILGQVVVQNGDYLHLDTTIPNTGANGGSNAAAAFPNGRRLTDDVVDTLLTIVNNRQTLGDSVDRSDILPRNQFPFFAAPQQPRNTGVTDDNTRN